MESILKIENLRLSFQGVHGTVQAVKGINLEIFPGERVALVGESGCGKTATCRAAMMLHSRHATVDSGHIYLCGQDVTTMTEAELTTLRGRGAAMVFQDPMSSLDPVFSVGRQIMEPILHHEKISKGEAKARAVSLLSRVGIENAEVRFHQYPHHFSGGMRQRVAIAIALACNPKLLICDEPTTALDVDAQGQIMQLLREVSREAGRGVLFVTHDLGLAREMADRIVVMKDGVIVESAATTELFANPKHAYTKELLHYARYGKSRSRIHGGTGEKAVSDAGAAVPSDAITDERSVTTAERSAEPLVEIRGLSQYFSLGKKHAHKVFEDFSLTIGEGEIIGMVGPSGCGKSTLARCLMGIQKPSSGTITFAPGCKKQMIFQDSVSAFNPRMNLFQIIAEPLRISCRKKGIRLDKTREAERVREMMELVGLSPELAERHPYDVSGGQRQRAAIARALITDPDFLIADEPITSLDVSLQAQIIRLLKDLCEKRHLTMLLIAHDLAMVEHISDRIVYL